jgi:TolB protein
MTRFRSFNQKTRLFMVAVGMVTSFMLGQASPAFARVQLNITEGNFSPIPIALPDFRGTDARSDQLGANIVQVIANDLEGSGLFKVVDKQAYLQRAIDANTPPNFQDWSTINAQALVAGGASMRPDGSLQVDFRVWDIMGQEQLVGQNFASPQDGWRRIAHKVADVIYSKLTGEKPYFDSQVVFVDEAGPKKNRIKRLSVMDQDGANVRALTSGKEIILNPRFSPVTQEVVYAAIAQNQSSVKIFNLQTGRGETVASFSGSLSFSPTFSPDGNRIALSMEKEGNIDIFLMDLRTRSLRRLTDSPSIDTSPSFSPDGSRIVFNSDRGGSQQLYVMGADGGSPQRISFGSGRYGTPQWSPLGDKIAFTKMQGGRFSIGVMDAGGGGERIVSSSFLDEGPTWAPNGRLLMYFRQQPGSAGRSKLYQVDISGVIPERPVDTPRDASDPSWSPLRK